MQTIGLFGGTFDPVHYGHLRTALELRHRLVLDEVRFLPCAIPPHRDMPTASAPTRLRMLRAAVDSEPGFLIDERELERAGPSYSVDTLRSLRADYPQASLCLLLGMDAFLGLPTWRAWRELLHFGHIVVAHRPGSRMPAEGELGELLQRCGTKTSTELRRSLTGRVHVQEVTQLEISSTELRASIRAGMPASYLVPAAVWNIIMETGCYAA